MAQPRKTAVKKKTAALSKTRKIPDKALTSPKVLEQTWQQAWQIARTASEKAFVSAQKNLHQLKASLVKAAQQQAKASLALKQRTSKGKKPAPSVLAKAKALHTKAQESATLLKKELALAQADVQAWQATHKKFQALEKHLAQFEKSWNKKTKKIATPKKKKKVTQQLQLKSKQAKSHRPSKNTPETPSDVIYSSDKGSNFT